MPATQMLIAVGDDGSSHARRALAWAIDEAALRHARVRVVRVWEPPFVEGYPYTGAAFDPVAQEAEARADTEAAVAEATAAAATAAVPVEVVVACGSPATTLLTHAKDADLLVVGSRGIGGFMGLLLGSVSHQVVSHAHCPVVVVRDVEHEAAAAA